MPARAPGGRTRQQADPAPRARPGPGTGLGPGDFAALGAEGHGPETKTVLDAAAVTASWWAGPITPPAANTPGTPVPEPRPSTTVLPSFVRSGCRWTAGRKPAAAPQATEAAAVPVPEPDDRWRLPNGSAHLGQHCPMGGVRSEKKEGEPRPHPWEESFASMALARSAASCQAPLAAHSNASTAPGVSPDLRRLRPRLTADMPPWTGWPPAMMER